MLSELIVLWPNTLLYVCLTNRRITISLQNLKVPSEINNSLGIPTGSIRLFLFVGELYYKNASSVKDLS